jgi:calnexin
MRFNAAITGALVSSATLMGQAHAEETEKKVDAASLVEKPTFTVSNVPINPVFPTIALHR